MCTQSMSFTVHCTSTWKVSIKCTCHYQILGTCIKPHLVVKVLHRKRASWPHSDHENNNTRENSRSTSFLFIHSIIFSLFSTHLWVCPWQVHRIRTFICSVLHNLSKRRLLFATTSSNKNLPLSQRFVFGSSQKKFTKLSKFYITHAICIKLTEVDDFECVFRLNWKK